MVVGLISGAAVAGIVTGAALVATVGNGKVATVGSGNGGVSASFGSEVVLGRTTVKTSAISTTKPIQFFGLDKPECLGGESRISSTLKLSILPPSSSLLWWPLV
jgi:hypothetical protein